MTGTAETLLLAAGIVLSSCVTDIDAAGAGTISCCAGAGAIDTAQAGANVDAAGIAVELTVGAEVEKHID